MQNLFDTTFKQHKNSSNSKGQIVLAEISLQHPIDGT